MKRVFPNPLARSNQPPATSQWQGTLTESACTWRENPSASKTSNALFVAGSAGLFTLVALAPVYFLGLSVASLAAFAKGLDPFPSAILGDPILWAPLVGSSAIASILILFLAAKSNIVAFTFDAGSEQLEYIDKRIFLPPITKRVPFRSIVEVVPTLMTTYATTGHFDITTLVRGRRTRSLWLGNDIPLAVLEAHSEWLAVHLEKRVQPVLYLDC